MLRSSMLLVAALAPLLPAGPAHAGRRAAPTASIVADLDGDTSPDRIDLSVSGYLELHPSRGRAPASVEVGAFARGTTLTAGGSGEGRWIVIAGTSAGGQREGVVIRWARGGATPEIRWRGAIGPVGIDGEYALAVAATPSGVVRYQTRADARRCDGGPAQLFAEGWDDATRAFRRIRSDIALPADTPTITAAAASSTTPRASVSFAAELASTRPGAVDARGLGPAPELDDGEPGTVWYEGTGSDGRGEFVTFAPRLDGAAPRAIVIVPGDVTAPATTNRVTRLAALSATGVAWIDVPNAGAPADAFVAELPASFSGCVTIAIAATRPGAGGRAGAGTTGIADLAVLGDLDLATGGAVPALLDRVVAGARDAGPAGKLLARRAGAHADIAARLLAVLPNDRAAALRLLRVLIAMGTAPAASTVAAHADLLDGADLQAGIRLIGERSTDGALAVARLVPTSSAATAAAALTWLGDLGARGAPALATLLVGADGPPAREAALAAALSRRSVDDVLALAAPKRSAYWQALVLAGRRADAAAQARARAALVAALGGAASYPARAWQARGLAAFGDAAALAALAAWRTATATSAETIAIDTMVAADLAANSTPAADAALRAALRHADPGVRIAALAGLARRRDRGDLAPPASGGASTSPAAAADAVDRLIGGTLAGDRWTDVRIAAADALAARCDKPEPRALLTSQLGRDATAEVRIAALVALAACADPGAGTGALLLATARDATQPVKVRLRAVELVPTLADPALEAPLADALAGWRQRAMDDGAAMALATRAVAAIAALRGPRAGALLIDALGDGAATELVAAAAAGLGALGPACPSAAVPLLRDLATAGSPDVALAARTALPRCGATPAPPVDAAPLD